MNRLRTTDPRVSHIPALLVGLTIVLGTFDASGSSLRVIGPATGSPIDRITARVVSNRDRHGDRRDVYDPSAVYSGIYAPDQLYRVVLGSERWAGSRHPARVREVTCRDARNALEGKGAWAGQLNANGTCGSGEPTDWATGNFLNFQAALQETDSDL